MAELKSPQGQRIFSPKNIAISNKSLILYLEIVSKIQPDIERRKTVKTLFKRHTPYKNAIKR